MRHTEATRHTESDLRALLGARAHDSAGREPAASLGAIVRRGHRLRRGRRVRRALTAGGALAAAVTLAFTLPISRPEAPPVSTAASGPADTARMGRAPEPPATFPVVLSTERFELPLIHAERFSTVGVPRTVTFTPASHYTGYKVVCADPRAWVVTVAATKSGEPSGTTGRCGKEGGGGHHDGLSAPSGWLKRPQSVEVWVFPADAPIRKVMEPIVGCDRTGCDEKGQAWALANPEVRDRLAAEVGEQPGAWAVGVYDAPREK
ncbi:hypothetical protein Nocox_24520 [Nonomuraea coxensis DSM 45129]|uniref:Uncharacterized protein n=1 Tax=Nonomuraea coxensis DSM 45129 TaxID=1122611 RepID=A0ABX8U774_9ACTN|nr:hypothetical protein [Nonomuraea coxensis]QYC42507.1 hypothetical protein Nocox_24520 [Nonomuraea coxensis DSM 45129]